MTYNEIKEELQVKKLEFFNVPNSEGEPSEWNRSQTLSGDFILLHNEAISSILESSGLFLKRKEDRIFEDGIPHRVFVLCSSEKTPAFAG